MLIHIELEVNFKNMDVTTVSASEEFLKSSYPLCSSIMRKNINDDEASEVIQRAVSILAEMNPTAQVVAI